MTDSYRPPDRHQADTRSAGYGPSSGASQYRPSYDRGPPRQTDGIRAPYPPMRGTQGSGVTNPDYMRSHAIPPPRPPPSSVIDRIPPPMRRFGEDRDRFVPSQNDFSFRVEGSNPLQYPDRPRDFRASRPPPRGPRAQRGGLREPPRRRDGRPFRPKIATASRPLLRFERGSTPEQLAGMNEDPSSKTFQNVDDLSDSDAQSMEESDDEAGTGTNATRAVKRMKLVERASAPAEDEKPKWSNPELYTALPPAEGETDRKRKDVVKLIRKARVMAERESANKPPVIGGDDFISFQFDDEEDQDEEHYSPPPINGKTGDPRGVPHPQTTEETVVQRLAAQSVKRKRESDDESVRLIAPKHKKGRGDFLNSGEILPDWQEASDADPTPWVKLSHLGTENGGFRLHKEICDFYNFVKPRPFEQQMRQELLDRLNEFIVRESEGLCTVQPFGSFAAGLFLPNADMDIVVVSKDFLDTQWKRFCQTRKTMFRLADALKQTGLATSDSVEVIHQARVPIIKFLDPQTRLRVDMSFENDSGLVANRTFLRWKAQFPAMPILVTIIKQFLMMRGLNNVANGGMGGFSVTCLVTSLLQNLPSVQMGSVIPEQHLGEMLIEFFTLYGERFQISDTAIQMEPPAYVDKRHVHIPKVNNPNRADRLCIIDPNRSDNDISGGTRAIGLIMECFHTAYGKLLNAMERGDTHESLLRCILGGNYNDFLWHRWQLRQLYERDYGSAPPNSDAI